MLDIMKHRAPDGSQYNYSPNFTIGMGRLAIIDLESPDLFPIVDGKYTLSFNGEIFNYLELKKELEDLGHDFRTKSDSEVLLKAYQEWGTGMFDKLNGMFAFAIHDGESILLARDLAGEKPLYFCEDPFEFASEAKALKRNDWKELSAGGCLQYDIARKTITTFHWWQLEEVEIKNPEEELEILFEDAIKIRTRSDVPYGLYYSGGVDSSLIAAFHNFEHKFTYKDGNYKKEFENVFEKIVWHLDYPIQHFSAFGLWKLAEETRSKGVKVILSGEGADELFGGYIRYLPEALYEQAQNKFPSYKTMFPVVERLHRKRWREFRGNLQELLRMADRMSSAFGIETRCPFLDKRIVNFAFSLPMKYIIDGFDTKVILKRILKKRNPDWQDFEKTGLYVSVNKWFGVTDPYDKTQYITRQKEICKKFR